MGVTFVNVPGTWETGLVYRKRKRKRSTADKRKRRARIQKASRKANRRRK